MNIEEKRDCERQGCEYDTMKILEKLDEESDDGVQEINKAPRCVELFNVLGDKWVFLPYDPDNMLKKLIEPGKDSRNSVVSIESVIDSIDRVVGIEYGDHVAELASESLEDEYTNSDVAVVLHVMNAHAEVEWVKSQLNDEMKESVVGTESYVNESNPFMQTFIMVRGKKTVAKGTINRLRKLIERIFDRSNTRAKTDIKSEAEK